MPKWKYVIIDEDGVEGTNDHNIAQLHSVDPYTTVVDTENGTVVQPTVDGVEASAAEIPEQTLYVL